MDAEAARTFLPGILKVAQMRARERARMRFRRLLPTAAQLRSRVAPALFTCSRTKTVLRAERAHISAVCDVLRYAPGKRRPWCGRKRRWPRWIPKGPAFVAADGPPYYGLIIVPVIQKLLATDLHTDIQARLPLQKAAEVVAKYPHHMIDGKVVLRRLLRIASKTSRACLVRASHSGCRLHKS
jgi:hypothetical protein